jgi:hypothetical protein
MLRLLPSSLDGLSDASAAACVMTVALIGGPEALRLLARWSPDLRGVVQRALAQVWRYFNPAHYADAVLLDAPLDGGRIAVELIEHVSHLRALKHLRDAQLNLYNVGKVNNLTFLRDAPVTTTVLKVSTNEPVDLAPLASCPALENLFVLGRGVSKGWELLATLPKLWWLSVNAPHDERDLSFIGLCSSLTVLALRDCFALPNVPVLASAPRLKTVSLSGGKRLCDLQALTELPELTSLCISDAPLSGGLDAVRPVLNQLKSLRVWWIPTVTSLQALVGSALEYFDLGSCPVTDLAPLTTLLSLKQVILRRLPVVNLGSLATQRLLRDLYLMDMEESADLSPLARTDHRLRLHLRDTATVGDPGPLVKILKC